LEKIKKKWESEGERRKRGEEITRKHQEQEERRKGRK
jgi:hypothetical protein